MRAHEFINHQAAANYFARRANVVGRFDYSDYTILLDEHLILRQEGRGIDEFVIREVLPKIPKAKAKIKTLATGQSFWLYDNTNKISLGVKILNQEHKIFLVKTVWDGLPSSDKNYPIFNVA